jgi:hypothetical protein
MNAIHILLPCILCVPWLTPQSAAQAFEAPPNLQASVLAPKDVPLKGDRYAVDAEVETDGLLVTYTIRSDFGKIEARGPGVLRMRVGEVAALDELSKMKKSDIFQESLKKSAASLGNALENVATNTAEVAKAVPASVGRFLERTARAAKTGAQKLGDVKDNKEVGAPKGAESGSKTQNLAVAAGAAAGTTALNVLGYDEKRRDLAKELHVDPYTTNPVLKKQLDDVAWAAFAGGLGVDVLARQIPGGRIVQSTSMVSDWIYEKPPNDLKVWIEKELKDLAVDQATIDLFLRQRHWTLTTQTALVMALEKMDGVEGRAEVLDMAVTAENEDQARFLAVGMSLLAREHESTPLKEILGGKPIAMTKKGRAIATMPLDYVTWSERAASFAGRDDLVANKPLVMVTGRLSKTARAEMEKLGWDVKEGLPLAGSF